jgi:hypothetical protein
MLAMIFRFWILIVLLAGAWDGFGRRGVDLSPILAPFYVQQEDLLSQLRPQFNFDQNELKTKDNNS